MASRKNPNKGLIDSIAALRAAIGTSDILTPEQAQEHGYISVTDFARDQKITHRGANNLLLRAHEQGKVERVRVVGGSRWGYWYRAKPSGKAK